MKYVKNQENKRKIRKTSFIKLKKSILCIITDSNIKYQISTKKQENTQKSEKYGKITFIKQIKQ